MKTDYRILASALYLATREESREGAGARIRRFLESIRRRYGPAAPAKLMEAMPVAIDKTDGIEEMIIECVRPLSDELISDILSGLDIDRSRVVVRQVLRPELIGGVRIRCGDRRYDATVKSNLERLAASSGGTSSSNL